MLAAWLGQHDVVRSLLHDLEGTVQAARHAIEARAPSTALHLLSGPGQLRGRLIRDEVRSGVASLLERLREQAHRNRPASEATTAA